MCSFEGLFACQRDSFLKEVLLIFHCFKMCVWKVQLKLSLLCKSHKSIWTCVVLEGIHRHFSKFSLLKVYAYFVLQLDVEVVSCTPSTLKIAGSKPIKGFDVIFTDTVLFPEGGGQVHMYIHSFCFISNSLNQCVAYKTEWVYTQRCRKQKLGRISMELVAIFKWLINFNRCMF